MRVETFNAKMVTKKGGVVDINETNLVNRFSVVYFYPKNGTIGCTKEACEFSNQYEEMLKLGFNVFGVSGDKLDSHTNFINKNNLKIPLISDPTREVALAFGVIKSLNPLTRILVNSKRETYVIDPNLEVFKVWKRVNPIGHAKEVMDFLKALHQ